MKKIGAAKRRNSADGRGGGKGRVERHGISKAEGEKGTSVHAMQFFLFCFWVSTPSAHPRGAHCGGVIDRSGEIGVRNAEREG